MISVALLHSDIHGGGLVTKSNPTLATAQTVDSQASYLWDFPGKNTGAGCHFLLQGIFLSNPGIKRASPALQMVSCLQVNCLPLDHQGCLNIHIH